MAVDNPFEVLTGRAPARTRRDPVTARVVRSDSTGVWCAPLGADTRHPLGPCRGATRRVFDVTGGGEAAHRHDRLEQLPAGTVVLLVFTDERPWVAAWEETT
jgi:hypothetical protein